MEVFDPEFQHDVMKSSGKQTFYVVNMFYNRMSSIKISLSLLGTYFTYILHK